MQLADPGSDTVTRRLSLENTISGKVRLPASRL